MLFAQFQAQSLGWVSELEVDQFFFATCISATVQVTQARRQCVSHYAAVESSWLQNMLTKLNDDPATAFGYANDTSKHRRWQWAINKRHNSCSQALLWSWIAGRVRALSLSFESQKRCQHFVSRGDLQWKCVFNELKIKCSCSDFQELPLSGNCSKKWGKLRVRLRRPTNWRTRLAFYGDSQLTHFVKAVRPASLAAFAYFYFVFFGGRAGSRTQSEVRGAQ